MENKKEARNIEREIYNLKERNIVMKGGDRKWKEEKEEL
jgi:hypothetical protein